MLKNEFDDVIASFRDNRYAVALSKLRKIDVRGSRQASVALYEYLESKLLEKTGETVSLQIVEKAVSKDAVHNTFLIVTPVYNGAKYIDETIESVVSQKGAFDIWYHVQDGGSTDGTLSILLKWEQHLANDEKYGASNVHFSWASQTDRGMYDAIAKGFDCLEGKINVSDKTKLVATWINSDDMLGINSLLTVDTFLSQYSDFSWVTGLGSTIAENGSITAVYDKPTAYSRTMLRHGIYDGRRHPSFLAQEGTFWRYSLWQQVKGINRLMQYAGDWDLWRRFAEVEPLIKIEAVLAYHRRHERQLSNDMDAYYAEMDRNTLYMRQTSLIRALECEEVNYRGVFDHTLGQWSAVSIDTDIQQIIDNLTHESVSIPDHCPTQAPKGKAWPKISIVTPSYNQGKYIRETIESVLSQGYPNVEYIIIDGGSTDGTIEVINEYLGCISYFVSEQDDGQSHAINKGFGVANGEIFTWLNSDDQFAPDALFSMALAFETSGADMVAGICEVYEDERLIHRHMTSCCDGELPIDAMLDLDAGWNGGQFFYQPEVFFKRTLWEKAGAHVREECFYSMDYELWCRFAAVKARLHVIGKPIVHFRSHPEQKTADPLKFKAELKSVKKTFIEAWNIEPKPINRPALDWGRHLKVAMVNDHGFRYGAGIAHQRIAAGFQLAGHNIKNFDLRTYTTSSVSLAEDQMSDAIVEYSPDFVVFGNIHSATKDSVSLISKLEKIYPTFWLTHDFWLFTGRCAYPNGCTKYLTGCDAGCPTPDEYPSLLPDKINTAWEGKTKLLSEAENLTILANSNWSADFASRTLSTFNSKVHVDQIKLGVPSEIFKLFNKQDAREKLGASSNNFTIAFSVSALSDTRKGGHLFIDALKLLDLPDITVILIGHVDEEFPVDNIEVISLGYVDHMDFIVQALNASDVYVGPSREETLGQVFLEAAMCGTPSIGFDATGVKNAIIDGVTGIRVKEMSASALAKAIAHLYSDRKFVAELGKLAHVYACNEFSIEASYRSFYNVFDRLGLVDAWKLPHKIGFTKEAELLCHGENTWFGLSGVSVVEGPYPELGFNEEFRWCHGQEIVLSIRLREGACRLNMRYLNPFLHGLLIDVYVNDGYINSFSLQSTNNDIVDLVVNIDSAVDGMNTIKIIPNSFLEASDNETRDLVFKLVDIYAS